MADDITVKVGFDGKAVEQGLNQLPKAAEKAGKQVEKNLTKPAETGLEKLRRMSDNWQRQLLGRFIGVQAAMNLVNEYIDKHIKGFERIAAVSNDAKKAGISAEDYQRLSNAAEMTGVSIDALGNALKKIRETTTAAADSNDKAIESLKALGYTDEQVRSGQIRGLDVLMRISRQYQAGTTQAQKYAAATALLGSAGADLIPVLEMSAAQQVNAFGGSVTTSARAEAAAAAKRYQDVTSGKDISELGNETAAGLQGSARRSFLGLRGYFGKTELSKQDFLGTGKYDLDKMAAEMNKPGLSPEERQQKQQELLDAFNAMSTDFRGAFTGVKIDGVAQTAAMVEAELDRKLKELIPGYTGPNTGPATTGIGATYAMGETPYAVSSMAAIGGGGTYFTGADVSVSLAERTANATETMAQLLERLANEGTFSLNPQSPVSRD